MARELITRISVHCSLHKMRLGVIESREEVQVLGAANEAKAKLLALVSHELRTPLSSIIGGVELVQLTNLTHEQRGHLSTIEYSAQMLLAIIRDILDIAKLETTDTFAFEISEFDPRLVLENATNELADRAAVKQLEFICFVDRNVPDRLSGDPNRIRQVIANLVHNSVKFTERGSLEVRVSLDPLEGPYEIPKLGRSNDQVRQLRVEVLDTGIGMESTERIFDPFWQVDKGSTRRFGGSGLGLTVSKQLVEKAGGQIGVTSVFGKGTKFWFTWPVELRSTIFNKRRSSTTDSTALSAAAQTLGSICIYTMIPHKPTSAAVSEILASAGTTKVYNVESAEQIIPWGSNTESRKEEGVKFELDERVPNVFVVDQVVVNSETYQRTLKQIQSIDQDIFLIYLIDRTLSKKRMVAIDGTLTKPVHRAPLIELLLKAADQKRRRPSGRPAIRKLRSTSITILPAAPFSLTLPKTPSELLSNYFSGKKGAKTPKTPDSANGSGGSYFTHGIDNSSKSSVASSSKRSSVTSLTKIDGYSPTFSDEASSTPSTPFTPFTPTGVSPKSKMKQVRILVAEDNQINQSLLIKQLHKIGYSQVDAANNGAEVLQMIDPRLKGNNSTSSSGKEKEREKEKDCPGYTLILVSVARPLPFPCDKQLLRLVLMKPNPV